MARRCRNNNTRFSLFVFQDIITCVMGIMLLLTLMMCLKITATAAVEATPPPAAADAEAESLAQQIEELQAQVDADAELLASGALENSELLEARLTQLQSDLKTTQAESEALQQQKMRQLSSASQVAAMRAQTETMAATATTLQEQNEELQKQIEQLQNGTRVIYNAHDSAARTCWVVELNDLNSIRAIEVGKSTKPTQLTSANLLAWMRQQHTQRAAFLLVIKPATASLLEGLTKKLREENIAYGFDLVPQEHTALPDEASP